MARYELSNPGRYRPPPVRMSKADRDDLARVARLRAKVARADVEARQAALLADAEAKLSAIYKFDEEVWAHITAEAERAVREADQRVAQLCRERGVPEDFRPGLHLSWHGRGQNAVPARRAELRRLAQANIQAVAEAARVAIDKSEAEVLTALIADGLESTQARAFLEAMPTAEQLMQPLTIEALEGARTNRLPAT